MKIKNLSNQELKLPMKKSNGQKIIVALAPGQIVYSEAEKKHENKQLVIWERKKLIEVTSDPLPQKLEYCHAYNTIKKAAVPTIAIEEDFDDDQDEETSEPTIDVSVLNGDDEDDDDINDDDINDDEERTGSTIAPTKNKGGRPKGAKNKSKRGKKKVKSTARKSGNNNSDSNAV